MVEAGTQAVDGPEGLGGWLILPIFGLFATIALTAVNLVSGAAAFNEVGWGRAYELMPGLTVGSGLSLLAGAAIIALAIWNLILIFNKDRRAPSYMVLFFALVAIIGTVEGLMLYYFSEQMNDPSLVEGEPRDTIRGWVAGAIWIPYFLNSKRVKNTFRQGA